jgi:hypothetical protein
MFHGNESTDSRAARIDTHTHKGILPSACIVLQNNETVTKY